MNTADSILLFSIIVLWILTYAWGWTQYCRAKNLEKRLDRMCAQQQAHLAASDELLATMRELERYNASLEAQLQRERIVQLHRRVEWGVN